MFSPNVPAADTDAQASLALAEAMKHFKPPVMGTVVRPSIIGVPGAQANLEQESPLNAQPNAVPPDATNQEQLLETDANDSPEEQLGTPEFNAAFEQYFGIKPEEASDVVNQLTAFRDETQLMRHWGVTANDYDTRMATVKQFYDGLPVDGREQFNTVEGAKAIWAHLVETKQVSEAPAVRRTTTSRAKTQAQPTQPKPTILKESDIRLLSNDEYKRRLPEITKAYRDGRVSK